MNTNQITQINKMQYVDELTHKAQVYNDVKATLDLCRTMIRALDTTTSEEKHHQHMLIEYLDLAQTEALLSAIDVEHEVRRLGK